MTIMQIPTSSFSRRILEAEQEPHSLQGETPLVLKVAQSDSLFQHLGRRYKGEYLNAEKLRRELPHTVHLLVHDKLADATHRNIWYTGYYLNTLHRERLNEAIWWECRGLQRDDEKCKLQAKQVIEAFCDHFGIELDVDINYDTLNKSWTRYRQIRERRNMNTRRMQHLGQNNHRFLKKNEARVVPENYRKTRKIRRKITTQAQALSDADLENIAQRYAETHPKLFLTRENKPRALRIKQLRCYVFYKIGSRRLCELEKTLQMPLKTIHTAAVAFMHVLLHAPAIDTHISSPFNSIKK